MNLRKQAILIGLAIASTAGMVDCNFFHNQTPTIMCSDFSVLVRPGTCTRIANPAGGEWRRIGSSPVEGFALPQRPGSIWVREVGSLEGPAAWSICAAANVAPSPHNLVFVYGRGDAFGTGHVTIAIDPALVLSVSASPEHIRPGEASQLVVTVSGGQAPYSYSWTPTSGLDVTNIPVPLAAPAITSTYTVRVTDHLGLEALASVTVHVGFAIIVSASPAQMNPGDDSSLSASGVGGTPPYSYLWSPPDGLDDPTVQNPVSFTPTDRIYNVVATDATGETRTGSVELRVNLFSNAMADPPAIALGGSSQLHANPSGGDGQYTYSWSPVTGLNDPTAANPIATPTVSTVYTVSVMDGRGAHFPGIAPVTVTNLGLGADFTFVRGALDPVERTIDWTFDGSPSTGAIATYTWDLLGNDGTTMHFMRTSPVLEIDVPETAQRGTMTLTVTAPDGTALSRQRPYR